MKKLISALLQIAVIFSFLYAVTSFIVWDLSPRDWPQEVRFAVGLFTLFGAFIIAVAFFSMEDVED